MKRTADVVIIGAGIAGASLAARLAGAGDIVLIDMEDHPGFHTTSRSAAMWEPSFGPPIFRALTHASGPFLHDPPDGFSPVPLVTERGVMMCGENGDGCDRAEFIERGYEEMSRAEATALVPLLRLDDIAWILFDALTKDVDVDALHQGFLRAAKAGGCTIACRARVQRAKRNGAWEIETSNGSISAPLVVIAAGAWADEVAARFGAAPLGLQPKRRSACIVAAPASTDISRWPQIFPAREDFYCKPTGGQLMVSPCDATPVDPHDAYADDFALAEGIAAFERLLDCSVTRVERSWGGLRTFAPDGDPVVGFDPDIEGVFWLAGQGGYGIQSSPALSELAAALLLRKDMPAAIAERGITAEAVSPARLRAAGGNSR
jgi:D-arginine dehydrogenase